MESPSKPPESSMAAKLMMTSFQKLKERCPSANLDLSFTTQNGRQVLTLKAEIDGAEEDINFQPPPRSATTFHQFGKLPAEIQKRVWELSFPEPRIFRLAEDKGKPWIPVVVSHKPPGFSQACHLSRLVYCKETEYALGSGGGSYKSLRVSPSRDVFYWDQDSVDEQANCLYFPGLECFENIAVNLPRHYPDLVYTFNSFFVNEHKFPNLENLIFVLEHNLPSNADVIFFDMDKDTTMFFDGEALHQDEIQERLQEELEERFPLLHAKPNFRFVEAARARARARQV
ncbi:hypothetical protein FPOA_00719 [Fusarium poae]|uniref:2EXR domain-containing protein n=1 Tax=Fusarium poae TaxID=36050 RepID=A0A1B8B234_FUSPO|nr:hypothetical protein FPOA_00719 [Fusarium poae]